MVRRSAPALPGLFVCPLAAHLSSAAPAFRLDESRIRLSLDRRQARVRVELLDPHDRVRATAAKDVRLRRGAKALDVPLELPYEQLLEAERKEFPWYRLRSGLKVLTAPSQLYDYYKPEARTVVAPTRFVVR